MHQPPRLIALMSMMRVVLRIEKKLETRLGDAAREGKRSKEDFWRRGGVSQELH